MNLRIVLRTILFLSLISSISCRQANSVAEPKITLRGKIINWAENKEAVEGITLHVDDFLSYEQEKYEIEINDDGTFETTFVKRHAQDFFLLNKNHLFYLFAKPGSELFVEIDAARFEEEGIKAVELGGDQAETNRHICDFMALSNQRLRDFMYEHQKIIRTLDGEDYKAFRLKKLQEDYDYFSDYLKEHEVTDEAQNWVKLGIKYECANDLMRYRWLHPIENKLNRTDFKLPDSYFDFFDEFELDNKDAISSSSFSFYLQEFFMYLRTKEFHNNGQPDFSAFADLFIEANVLSDDEKQFIQKIRNYTPEKLSKTEQSQLETILQRNAELVKTGIIRKRYNDFIDYLFTNLTGFARDACVSRFFYDTFHRKEEIDLLKPALARFNEVVETTFMKKRVMAKLAAVEKLLADLSPPAGARLFDFPADSSKALFENFISQYKNKVVYIDVWATWCEPCRRQFPFSNELHEKLNGEDVAFVYLCGRSPKKLWQATIKEFNLVGDHYFLQNEQYEALKAKFKITGIPHYILVDKNGQIASAKAQGPGASLNKVNDALLADIDTLLLD